MPTNNMFYAIQHACEGRGRGRGRGGGGGVGRGVGGGGGGGGGGDGGGGGGRWEEYGYDQTLPNQVATTLCCGVALCYDVAH